jgi:hypothetical protein
MNLPALLYALRKSGVYKIPCECSRVHTEQTGRSVDNRLKENQWQIQLEHPDKSAVGKHSIGQGQRTQFHNASNLAMKTRYVECIVREATGILLRPLNMNREDGFCLSILWKPLTCSLTLLGPDTRST